MRNFPRTTLALICALLLSACGELTYKRGAQTADLEQDRSACHAAEKPGLSYEQCMASRGWMLHNLDEEPLLATVGIAKDNRDTAFITATDPVAVPVQVAGTAAGTNEAAGEKPPLAVKEPAKSANPMDQLKVNSFWKLGGNSGELQTAIDSCVAKLGAAHQPSADKQLMTRGLVRCLREQSWYGVTNR